MPSSPPVKRWEKWDPSSLPHNSNLKLSDSRNQFLGADQVELIDGYEDQEDQSYTSADGYKVRVAEQKLILSYYFKGNQFDGVNYRSEYGLSKEEQEPIFNALKTAFDAVYGEGEEYTGFSTLFTGYIWYFKDNTGAVSYTHLDVYKRQVLCIPVGAFCRQNPIRLAAGFDRGRGYRGNYRHRD